MLNLFRGMEKGNIVLNSRKYDGICKNYGRKIKKHLHRTSMYGVQRNREVFRMKYVKRTKPAENVGFVLFDDRENLLTKFQESAKIIKEKSATVQQRFTKVFGYMSKKQPIPWSGGCFFDVYVSEQFVRY